MSSPWRDPERKGGWVPWRERLLPLIAMPGEWVDFPMTTVNVANKTAYHLRRGLIPVPPGHWEFRGKRNRVQAKFLGPPDLTGA
jgi:hypothetical protein